MIVDVVRRFNLTYTQRIGVLDDSFLGTGRPLAASRLLFEVGNDEGASVRVLRDRLDLDSGTSRGCCGVWRPRGSWRRRPTKMIGAGGWCG